MDECAFNAMPEGESVRVRRHEDGSIVVVLMLDVVGENRFDEVLALLSCWFLRWLGLADCRFYLIDHAWCVQCRLESASHGVLVQILRDLLAIKNAVCL